MEASYIVDENGERVSVILPIEALEELEDIRAYDEAEAELEQGEHELIPWEKVEREIGSEFEEPTGWAIA